jgi:TPR repeat protein
MSLVRGFVAIGLIGIVVVTFHPMDASSTDSAVAARVYRVAAKKKTAVQAPIAAKPVDVGDPAGKPAFDEAWAKANGGDIEAMANLADYYERGWGVAKSEHQAFVWHKRRFDHFMTLAEKGDTDALWQVANSYEFGSNGMVADPQKAAEWQKRYRDAILTRAQSGDLKAMETHAELLEGSDTVPADYAAALMWWQKAAAGGSYAAMTKLAEKYDDGVDVPAERAQAFAWYLKAEKEPGDGWGARRELAHKYKTGDGTAKNVVEAARLHVAYAESQGGWRKRMRAEGFAEDVTRSEPDYRRAVQKELADRGLYKGPVDGSVSPALDAAIKAVWRRLVKDE